MEGLKRAGFAVMVVVAVIGALIFALRPAAPTIPAPGAADVGAETNSSESAIAIQPPPRPPSSPSTVLPIDPKRVLEKPPSDRPKCEGLEFVDQWEGKSHTRGCIIMRADGGIIREGPWIMQDPEAWTSAGSFKDNKKEGRWTRWYPSGAVAAIDEWAGDQQDGLEVRWDESGARVLQRTWKDGFLDGVEEVSFEDGTTVRRVWKRGVEQK